MDLEQRDQLFESIADSKSRMAILGSFDDGWDDCEVSERRQAEAMDDAALKAALIAAHTEVNASGGEIARRRLKVIREAFKARYEWLSATVGETRNRLERDPPPQLAAAIKRMEQALEFARNLGKSQFMFSGAPGGDALTSARGRTAADEQATQRIERAVEKLRNLIFVPCDLTKSIADIVREADIGAIWTELPASPPSSPAFDKRRDNLKAASISDQVAAEIVPDDEPRRRERLLPAG